MKRLVLTFAILIGLAAPAWAGLEETIEITDRRQTEIGYKTGEGTMRAWIRTASSAAALSLLVGCADSEAERWKEAMQRANQVVEACVEKRLRGELAGYVAGHRCAESLVRRVLAESEYPHMDLVNLRLAYDLAVSRRIDGGKISGEFGGRQIAELTTRITNEIQRRGSVQMQMGAEWRQTYGKLLQGLGIWNRSLNPPALIGDLITCTHIARTITCY